MGERTTHTRLDRDHRPRGNPPPQPQIPEQLILILRVGVAPDIMRVHAQIMPQPVREEGDARPRLHDLLLIALEDSDGKQPLNGDLVGAEVHVIPEDARLEHADTLALHAEGDVVDCAGLGGELAREGERASLVFVSISTGTPTQREAGLT